MISTVFILQGCPSNLLPTHRAVIDLYSAAAWPLSQPRTPTPNVVSHSQTASSPPLLYTIVIGWEEAFWLCKTTPHAVWDICHFTALLIYDYLTVEPHTIEYKQTLCKPLLRAQEGATDTSCIWWNNALIQTGSIWAIRQLLNGVERRTLLPEAFVDHLQSQVEGSRAQYKHTATSPPLKAAVLLLHFLLTHFMNISCNSINIA